MRRASRRWNRVTRLAALLAFVSAAHVAPAAQDEGIEGLRASDGSLSLAGLTRQVIERNPSVEEAVQSLRAAAEGPEQARALDDPMFSYSLAPATLGSGDVGVGQQFEVSQSFPWPGKRRLRGEAAQFDAEVLRGDLEAVREALAYEAREAFLDFWFLDRSVEINATNQNLLAEFEAIAARQYGAGIAPKQDALQAQVEREMLVHDGLVLGRRRNRVAARINALLNRGADWAIPSSPVNLPAPVRPPALDELQATAEEHRPELRGVASRIRSAETRTSLARQDFYPDFALRAGYDSFWDVGELKPSVGFSINVPIQVGRRRAALRQAEAELASAQARARRQHWDILLEVHEAFEVVHEGFEGVILYESKLVPGAVENFETARSAYSSGAIDFLSLLSAQKLLMDTTLRAKESHVAYHLGMARLDHAVGLSIADSPSTED